MRHRSKTKKLDRNRSARRALIRSLAIHLVNHNAITTTAAKAKVLRPFVERLITRGKGKSMQDQRILRKLLSNPAAVHILATTLADRYQKRPGGYTRQYHLPRRQGDGSHLIRIELVP